MTHEQKVIAALLSSLIDLANGWPVRELHEPIEDTINRALLALPEEVRHEFDKED
jgi:hypothetical protein